MMGNSLVTQEFCSFGVICTEHVVHVHGVELSVLQFDAQRERFTLIRRDRQTHNAQPAPRPAESGDCKAA